MERQNAFAQAPLNSAPGFIWVPRSGPEMSCPAKGLHLIPGNKQSPLPECSKISNISVGRTRLYLDISTHTRRKQRDVPALPFSQQLVPPIRDDLSHQEKIVHSEADGAPELLTFLSAEVGPRWGRYLSKITLSGNLVMFVLKWQHLPQNFLSCLSLAFYCTVAPIF